MEHASEFDWNREVGMRPKREEVLVEAVDDMADWCGSSFDLCRDLCLAD
jgi:hypothetical protein